MHPACYLAIQLDGLSGGERPMEAGCIAETVVAGLTSEGEGWSTQRRTKRVRWVEHQQVVRVVTSNTTEDSSKLLMKIKTWITRAKEPVRRVWAWAFRLKQYEGRYRARMSLSGLSGRRSGRGAESGSLLEVCLSRDVRRQSALTPEGISRIKMSRRMLSRIYLLRRKKEDLPVSVGDVLTEETNSNLDRV